MEKLRLSDQLPKLLKSDLARFEQELGRPLPTEYISFLSKTNGGYPNLSWFTCEAGKGYDVFVDVLYGISHDEDAFNTNPYEWRQCRGVLPDFIIPIGENGEGDLLCLSIGEATFGHVYWWHHEMWSGENVESIDDKTVLDDFAFNPVADNFEAFLTLLRKDQEPEEATELIMDLPEIDWISILGWDPQESWKPDFHMAPCSLARLLRLETKVGSPLPVEYTHFMRTYNGGRPSRYRLTLEEFPGLTFEVKLHSIGTDCMQLPEIHLNQRDWIPPFVFYFGWVDESPEMSDRGMHYIAMRLDPERYGSIYFLDILLAPQDIHPRNMTPDLLTTENGFFEVAPDFMSFLKMLE